MIVPSSLEKGRIPYSMKTAAITTGFDGKAEFANASGHDIFW